MSPLDPPAQVEPSPGTELLKQGEVYTSQNVNDPLNYKIDHY